MTKQNGTALKQAIETVQRQQVGSAMVSAAVQRLDELEGTKRAIMQNLAHGLATMEGTQVRVTGVEIHPLTKLITGIVYKTADGKSEMLRVARPDVEPPSEKPGSGLVLP